MRLIGSDSSGDCDVNEARLNAMEIEIQRLRVAVMQLERERDEAKDQRDEFIHFITAHRQLFEAQRNGGWDGQ